MLNEKIKKVLLASFVVVILVMMFFIQRGERNVVKYYDVENEKYVTVDFKGSIPLRGNLTSLHTSVLGRVMDRAYGTGSDPKIETVMLEGTKPILYHDDSIDMYGYMDKNGNILIPPQYRHANEFDDYGLAVVYFSGEVYGDEKEGYAVLKEDGSYLIEPDFHNGVIVISEDYKVILVDDKEGYWIYSIDGDRKQQISREDFDDCVKTDLYYIKREDVITIDNDSLDKVLKQIDFGGDEN